MASLNRLTKADLIGKLQDQDQQLQGLQIATSQEQERNQTLLIVGLAIAALWLLF